MGVFDFFFSNNNTDLGPQIQFGRYSDAYKEEKKYDSWDKAMVLYEEGNYLQSYQCFFDYLLDESIDNVNYEIRGGELYFTLYQGSKKITGRASENNFTAEAKIAKTNNLHIGFLRRLLEENYQLKYCRYALDNENNLTSIFTSYSIDASPYKVYYALKELSTRADKKDDILINEFEILESINDGHIRQIDEQEKRIKFDYKNKEIDRSLSIIENSDLYIEHYPGAVSYLYLDLIYRLDYLIKPEGEIMEVIDTIHNLYFFDKTKSAGQKNNLIKKKLEYIKILPYDKFSREIYEVKSTFSTSQSSGLQRIQEFITSELKNMDWYYQNGHQEIAQAIPSYIVGYSLFSYSMPVPLRELLNLFYQITQPEYFSKLGIRRKYKVKTHLNSVAIKKEIKHLISKNSSNHPYLKIDMKLLNFTDLCSFCKSYLTIIQQLNFQRRDNR